MRMARRKSSVVDDLILCPWWVSAVLAVLAYVLLPGLLPKPYSASGLIGMATLGLFAISALAAFRSFKTSKMLEAQTGIDSLRALPWERFEDLLGEAYRREGYRVEETLGGGADGGVDLVLGRQGEVTLVQCKRWKGKPVPVQIVREMFGILIARGAKAAKVVATTNFTSEAIDFAKGKPIELVGSDDLLTLLRGVQVSRRIVAPVVLDVGPDAAADCPKCGSNMVLREAKRGANAGSKFFGCSSYPRCKGTRPT